MRRTDRLMDDLWMAADIAWYSLPYMGLMGVSYGAIWACCMGRPWLALVAFLAGALLFGRSLERDA